MAWAQIIFGLLFVFILTCGGCSQPTSGAGALGEALTSEPSTSGDPGSTTPTNPPSASGACDDTRTGFADSAIVEQVCVLVNQERSTAGVGGLQLDPALSKVAQAFAEDMVNRGYFNHTSPEGLGPADRLKAGQISYNTWGENIAYYYKTPEAVMTSWMNSSGHKANILNSKFGKIGIGYYQNYWVQDFTN